MRIAIIELLNPTMLKKANVIGGSAALAAEIREHAISDAAASTDRIDLTVFDELQS